LKKIWLACAIISLLASSITFTGSAAANATGSGIAEIYSDEVMLMEDGSLWTGTRLQGPAHYSEYDITAISPAGYSGYALNSDGRLLEWKQDGGIEPVTGQTGIIQLFKGTWLKRDGTVWNARGQVEIFDNALSDVARISTGSSFSYLTKTGELISEKLRKPLATGLNPSSVAAIAASGKRTLVLDAGGRLTEYDLYNFDKNLNIIPVVLTEQAQWIGMSGNDLFVVLKDGTLATRLDYDPELGRDKMRTLEGLKGVARLSGIAGPDSFYVRYADGSWKGYSNGKLIDVQTPSVAAIEFTVDYNAPMVGEKIKATIVEKHSTGSSVQVPLGQADVTIEKPHLLAKQADGTFLATGVGVTNVTVKKGDASKTIAITISLPNVIQGAKMVQGVTYFPVKPVFQALGGTVTYVAPTKSFDIRVGSQAFRLTTDSAKATVDGKAVTLKGVVRADNGQTLFPAHLLADALGAKLTWDAEWKAMTVSFGSAEMEVWTDETVRLYKRTKQGELAAYIGKTYWVNHFQGWDRFMKVTVADVVPNNERTGFETFTIVFRLANGKTLNSFPYTKSEAIARFTDSSSLLNYDPYTKYKWSSSVWSAVKAGKISLGMNKDQVLMSWGSPSSSSKLTSSGIAVETWGYSNFRYVTFTNGKVTQIYS